MAIYDDLQKDDTVKKVDRFRQYRDPNLSEEEFRRIAQAQEESKTMLADPTLERRPGGFWNEKEGFTPHPVVSAHIFNAMERAKKQFEGKPVMPEDEEVALRFPGVDPVGKYGLIDMKFAQREAAIRAALESRSPEVQKYVKGLLDNCVNSRGKNFSFYSQRFSMVQCAMQHREITRGSKLCLDQDGVDLMHEQARNMETDLAVTQYDKLMQGIEYAAGVRRGPVPKEITDHYKNTLQTELNPKIVAAAAVNDPTPAQLQVDFQDLDHKLLHQAFADPENWNKTPQELEKAAEAIPENRVSQEITPYAKATAARVIDPIFRDTEKATGGLIHRADLVIVDGETIREKLFREYTASGQKAESFDNFFEKHAEAATHHYVASGLMAGKRVEAFIPDKEGRIPAEPTQITKTGYEPSPLKPERFNAWQRHFAKHGFYKNKVARQAEYERLMAARDRVKLLNTANQWEADRGVNPHAKVPFVSGYLRDTGDRDVLKTDRDVFHSLCVCRMLMDGHSLEDIQNPDALPDVKEQIGREVIQQHIKGKDERWAGETIFHGLRLLRDEMNQRTAGLDFSNEAQMLSPDRRLAAFAANVAFNLAQNCEVSGIHEECLNAAGAYVAEQGLKETGQKYFDDLHAGVAAPSQYFRAAEENMRNRAYMAGGIERNDVNTIVPRLMRYEAMKTHIAAACAAAPEKGVCGQFLTIDSIIPFATADAIVRMSQGKAYDQFQTRVTTDPQFRQDLGKELVQGRFQERLKVTTTMTGGKFEIAPPKKGELDISTPEKLEAPKKQQAQQKKAPQKKDPQLGGPKR